MPIELGDNRRLIIFHPNALILEAEDIVYLIKFHYFWIDIAVHCSLSPLGLYNL